MGRSVTLSKRAAACFCERRDASSDKLLSSKEGGTSGLAIPTSFHTRPHASIAPSSSFSSPSGVVALLPVTAAAGAAASEAGADAGAVSAVTCSKAPAVRPAGATGRSRPYLSRKRGAAAVAAVVAPAATATTAAIGSDAAATDAIGAAATAAAAVTAAACAAAVAAAAVAVACCLPTVELDELKVMSEAIFSRRVRYQRRRRITSKCPWSKSAILPPSSKATAYRHSSLAHSLSTHVHPGSRSKNRLGVATHCAGGTNWRRSGCDRAEPTSDHRGGSHGSRFSADQPRPGVLRSFSHVSTISTLRRAMRSTSTLASTRARNRHSERVNASDLLLLSKRARNKAGRVAGKSIGGQPLGSKMLEGSVTSSGKKMRSSCVSAPGARLLGTRTKLAGRRPTRRKRSSSSLVNSSCRSLASIFSLRALTSLRFVISRPSSSRRRSLVIVSTPTAFATSDMPPSWTTTSFHLSPRSHLPRSARSARSPFVTRTPSMAYE